MAKKRSWKPFYCPKCMVMPRDVWTRAGEEPECRNCKWGRNQGQNIPDPIELPYEFHATMKFVKTYSGYRGKFWLVLTDTATNITYTASKDAIADIIRNSVNGVVTGSWQIIKKGTAMSIQLMKEDIEAPGSGGIF